MLPRTPVHQTDRTRSERTAARRRADADGDGTPAETGTAAASPGVRRFLIVLALLGSIQLAIMLGVEAYRAVEGQRAVTRLQNDIAALEAEAAELSSAIEHADDLAYREQLARKRGFVYPDETRIVPLR